MAEPPKLAVSSDALPTTHRALEDDYELGALLGRGGMGEVYSAIDRWTHARVAVKLMHDTAAFDAERISRFIREARAIARIDHPNVVRVLGMGRTSGDGSLFIVQEFLNGESLRKRMDRAPRLTPNEVRSIIRPVMCALGAAHALGIIHRDVKPENIVLARGANGETTPRLIDFGIAKILDECSDAPTATGQVLGTAAYMSPEQARGRRDLDARTDIWSVGAVLYEMLAGRPVFEGDSYNARLAAILTSEPTPLSASVPTLAPDVAALVDRMLTSDRESRPDSMALLVEQLDACAGFGDTVAPVAVSTSNATDRGKDTEPSDSQSTPPSVAVARSAAPSTASGIRGRGARRLAVASFVALSVLAMVVLGFLRSWNAQHEPRAGAMGSLDTRSMPHAASVAARVPETTMPSQALAEPEPANGSTPLQMTSPPPAPVRAPVTTPATRSAGVAVPHGRTRTPQDPRTTPNANAPSRGTNGAVLLDPLADE